MNTAEHSVLLQWRICSKNCREIWDEDEEIEHNYYKIGKGEFLVNGDMELEDMLGLFDMDEDSLECDSVTVGGYILEHAGTIPHKRDNIEADGFKFTVMEVKDQRILRVVVKKNEHFRRKRIR